MPGLEEPDGVFEVIQEIMVMNKRHLTRMIQDGKDVFTEVADDLAGGGMVGLCIFQLGVELFQRQPVKMF
jgi:hypothetical protein